MAEQTCYDVIEIILDECRDIEDAVDRTCSIEGLSEDRLIRKGLLYSIFTLGKAGKMLAEFVDIESADVDWDAISNCLISGWNSQTAPIIWDVITKEVPKVAAFFDKVYKPEFKEQLADITEFINTYNGESHES